MTFLVEKWADQKLVHGVRMPYFIADLFVEIPAVGDLVPRCKDYLCDERLTFDIAILEEELKKENWTTSSESLAIYLESGFQFYKRLLEFNGLMLHASAVELDGKAYLFSGPCGMGKSTHTKLWKKLFGEKAIVFNDDKPALRRLEEKWYAYGTPWCGKDGINENRKVPLAGICFLQQADQNKIRRLTNNEAMQKIISQTTYKLKDPEMMNLMLNHVESLIQEIPVYLLENRPEPEAAYLSYKTMKRGAEEMNL